MLRRLKNSLAFPLIVTLVLIGVMDRYRNSEKLRAPSSLNTEKDSLTGPDIPVIGRSNFDIVFSSKQNGKSRYDIPFPLENFVARLENYSGLKLNKNDSNGLVGAIFPMGRSLQRNAAIHGAANITGADLYFQYPRVVLAVDGETENNSVLRLNLKNKFYAGYNEKAEVLEVISFNESMGRFEYQIVNDYAAGKSPKVRYAPRGLCLTCHQNQAPIFSKSPWSESNANPAISAELKRVLGSEFYHGAQINIDEAITGRFDTSTDQANLLPVYQKIWKEICATEECRTNVLLSILQLRLNKSHLNRNDFRLQQWMEAFDSDWKKTWPDGLKVDSGDIPNRDPFRDVTQDSSGLNLDDLKKKFATVSELLLHSKIPAVFEPLIPRAPAETWMTSSADVIHGNRLVRGLAKEFTQFDIRAIDGWLESHSAATPVATLRASCKVEKVSERLSVDCPVAEGNNFSFSITTVNPVAAVISNFTLNAVINSIEDNLIASAVAGIISYKNNVAQIKLRSLEGISLRTPAGYVLSEVSINLDDGQAELKMLDQSAELLRLAEQSVKSLTSGYAFSRFAVMKNLIEFATLPIKTEDIDRSDLPTGPADSSSGEPLTAQQNGFNIIKNNCRECHRNNEGAPSNFLGTNESQLSDKDLCRRIEVCAPRLLYRLKVRLCNPADIKNKKVPMPPDFFLSNHKISREKWMTEYNPKILSFLNELVNENELARDIESGGVTQSEATNMAHDILSDKCPDSSSIMYDRLPKCEFEELKAATRCR